MAVELVSQQNGALVNGTRAAEAPSQPLDTSRWTIIQVEVQVTLAAALMLLQLILGTWKRRWHNSVVSATLSVCNASLLPLVFYTLSIMPSPVMNSMYPVWGALLLMAAGGTIAVNQFDYGQDKTKAMMQLQWATGFARYLFYLFTLILLLAPCSFKESSKSCVYSEGLARESSISILLLYSTLYLTKAMDLHRYFPRLLGRRKKNANGHQNGEGTEFPFGLITIDKIWKCCDKLSRGKTLQEASLSLALCQSLIPRLRGFSSAKMRIPSAEVYECFNGLLHNGEHYERAFRIIELELGFCYDFFFTKYHIIYYSEILYFLLFLLRVNLTILVLVYTPTAQGSVTIRTLEPIIQVVQITRADNIITLALLGIALVVELLQALFYLASDWINVSLAYKYVKHKPSAILEKLIGFCSRVAIFAIFSPRRKKISQYTVILPEKFFSKCNLHPVEISPEIEKAIAGSIKPTFGEQTSRLASQVRNSMFKHKAVENHWTLKDHSQVEIMLIWQIATDYCHHFSPSSEDESNPDRDVAVTLSRYCAYLLAFVPQLMPYHEADIKELIDTVKKEIAKDLQSSGAPYRKMKELGDGPPTVFREGVKLAKELEGMPDDGERWKAMAEFWAKTIIYVAPSHITAKEHMRQLENGGEFLTHIWALLSHAGILNLVRDDDEVAMPAQAQPTQETV